MKQKTISLLLALALVLSLAGCKKEETVTAPAGVAVQVQTVEAQDIASENTVSGQVTAGSETSVYVTATAKCTAVYVEAGDAVKAGDVICSLDMESSLAQYRAAEIGYTSAASSYSDQKNILDRQVALYEKNWNDTKALFEIGAASQSEVDQMELQYLSTKAQRDSTLAQLEASMQSAKSSLPSRWRTSTAMATSSRRWTACSPRSPQARAAWSRPATPSPSSTARSR